MVKLIVGKKGTGKTKILLDTVDKAVENAHGNIVFIGANFDHVHNLDREVRLINAKEYDIVTYREFICFLKGATSQNYDITHIFIDGVFKIIDSKLEGLEEFIDGIKGIADASNIEFTISLSADASELPESLKDLIA